MENESKNLESIVRNILETKPGSENIEVEKAIKRVKDKKIDPNDTEKISEELQSILVENNIQERQQMGDITLEDLYPLVEQTVKYHNRILDENSIDNEDIVQNVMLKIYNKWDNFRGECKLATWVFRIVKNEVINMVVYQNREKRKVSNRVSIDESPMDFEKQNSNLEANIINHESMKKVYEKIDQMKSERDKNILKLVLSGTDYKDVVEIVGVNYATVRRVVHQARNIKIDE
jgi:RNA polymerase sigma-70 factor (ECF subfamily)